MSAVVVFWVSFFRGFGDFFVLVGWVCCFVFIICDNQEYQSFIA